MRLYTRKEFMELPAGTIYVKTQAIGGCEGLCVKSETMYSKIDGESIDFYCRELTTYDADDSKDAVEKWDAMLKNKKSVSIEQDYGRDGMFDNEDLFLVYEENDLNELISVFKEAIYEHDDLR